MKCVVTAYRLQSLAPLRHARAEPAVTRGRPFAHLNGAEEAVVVPPVDVLVAVELPHPRAPMAFEDGGPFLRADRRLHQLGERRVFSEQLFQLVLLDDDVDHVDILYLKKNTRIVRTHTWEEAPREVKKKKEKSLP